MVGTICDLAWQVPRVVGTLLDRERKLKRGRFREETLTDVFVASLAGFAGPELIIQYPHEASTGGDIDLEFWHVESGRQLLLRLQAKRLNSAENSGKIVEIKHRSYRELLHIVPTTGNYQFDTLVKSSDHYLPLYIFYNHGSVVANPHYSNMSPRVSGINLAFASDVARELRAKINARPKVLHHKRLSHLQPFFFGLEKILCPGAKLAGNVPTPDAVLDSLQRQWRQLRADDSLNEDQERALKYLFDPTSLKIEHNPRRRLPDGPAIRSSTTVERDTITLISGRTEDERTPKIIGSHQDRPS